MANFNRSVNPLYGGPQLGQFRTAGAYGGGAPAAAQPPARDGDRGVALDPQALMALLLKKKMMDQAEAQAQGQAGAEPQAAPPAGGPEMLPPGGMPSAAPGGAAGMPAGVNPAFLEWLARQGLFGGLGA
jgi:hypothetical protein